MKQADAHARPTADPSLCIQALRMRRAAHRVTKWAPGGQTDESQAARNRATAIGDLLLEAEGLRRLLDDPAKRGRGKAAGAPGHPKGEAAGEADEAPAEPATDPDDTPALPLPRDGDS